MVQLRRQMTALGMLVASCAPAAPAGGRALTCADFDPAGRPHSAAARDYCARWHGVLGDRSSADGRGIPEHKLATNDGWHVTRQECAEALVAHAQADHPPLVVPGFTRFLHAAARHHGFRVL